MERLTEYWKKKARAKDFRISIITPEERHHAIERCQSIIDSNHGDILDFKMFSNMSLNMIVELPTNNIQALIDSLKNVGWKVDYDLEKNLKTSKDEENLEGTLVLMFSHADGELRIPVPAVPG